MFFLGAPSCSGPVVLLDSICPMQPPLQIQLCLQRLGCCAANRFCHRKLRDYAAAAADYTRLLELGHRSVRTFNSRAYCYASLGRYREAVQDYDEVLKRDPSNMHAWHNRYGGLGLQGGISGAGCRAEFDLPAADKASWNVRCCSSL